MRMLFISLAFFCLPLYLAAMEDVSAPSLEENTTKNLKPKEVDCLEKCLQEHGAINHKAVQPWKNSCLKYHKKNPQKQIQCELDAKERIRLLDIGSIKICQESC